MDTRYLQYFITIAEERNMTKAAERLFVSQSSLSYQLSKLEKEVGTSLFLRTKNDMILTQAGSLYMDTALRVIALKDLLYQNIEDINQRGHLRISVTSLWGNKLLSEVLPEFKKEFPELIFKVNHVNDQEALKTSINKGELDFALISVPFFESANERTELLGREELFFAVYAGHPYVSRNPGDTITQEELADSFFSETIIASKKTSANYQLMEQLFKVHKGALPHNLCEVNGMPLTRSLIAQEIGMGFIPVSAKGLEESIHYYSCEPKVFRYNVMMHRENLIFNQPEQSFFNYVINYYKKNIGPIVTAPVDWK